MLLRLLALAMYRPQQVRHTLRSLEQPQNMSSLLRCLEQRLAVVWHQNVLQVLYTPRD